MPPNLYHSQFHGSVCSYYCYMYFMNLAAYSTTQCLRNMKCLKKFISQFVSCTFVYATEPSSSFSSAEYIVPLPHINIHIQCCISMLNNVYILLLLSLQAFVSITVILILDWLHCRDRQLWKLMEFCLCCHNWQKCVMVLSLWCSEPWIWFKLFLVFCSCVHFVTCWSMVQFSWHPDCSLTSLVPSHI